MSRADRERFDLIVNGPALFQAIVSAHDLGVFTALEDTSKSILELSTEIGITPRKAEVLILGLAASGLVRRSNGTIKLTKLARAYFLPGTGLWGDILTGWREYYYPAFPYLTTALKENSNIAISALPGDGDSLYKRLDASAESQRSLHRSMSAFTMQSLPALLDNLDLSGVSHLVDVGSGDGTTAVALASKYPGLHITMVDLPNVLHLASLRCQEVGVLGRVTLLAGDFFELAFPRADVFLFSHVLEVFSENRVRELLAKARAALHDDGETVIYGFDPGGWTRHSSYSARLAIYLTVLATGEGMTYSADQYSLWMEETGYGQRSILQNLPFEHSLIVGRATGESN